MAGSQDRAMSLEDEYDEEADSDFEVPGLAAGDLSSSSDNDGQIPHDAPRRPRKRRKIETQAELITELDSGDEATIREQKKTRRKGKKEAAGVAPEENENDSEGWRARTRAMRTKEREERQKNKLASRKESTIDVNKIWEEMNRSEPLPPPHTEDDTTRQRLQDKDVGSAKSLQSVNAEGEKENTPVIDGDETIIIKRTYKFAGEVHVEEKSVSKSSAEAQLWLAQQRPSKAVGPGDDGKGVNRPSRKISRFDPNISNLNAFKGIWTGGHAQEAKFKGPKLNVVEKSKMDWAAHVDTEGLKDELNVHAKAKEGYLTRMDFLREVEERRESEAKAARLKGR